MAEVIITIKIMPESLETELKGVEKEAKDYINKYGEVGKVEMEEVAFGLKAINLTFVVDENKGGTDELEDLIRNIDGVGSAEVTDVRRAIG
jgi:elongation factor 1-beta